MQMMGMSPTGGGSNAGGTTDKLNAAVDGAISDPTFESRTVDTVGGAEEEWSEEFKDALKAYYDAMENVFSWFDYRSKGFDREPRRGLRIDHLMVSELLRAAVVDALSTEVESHRCLYAEC